MATIVQIMKHGNDEVIVLTLPDRYKSEQFMDDFVDTLMDAKEIARAQYMIEDEEDGTTD